MGLANRNETSALIAIASRSLIVESRKEKEKEKSKKIIKVFLEIYRFLCIPKIQGLQQLTLLQTELFWPLEFKNQMLWQRRLNVFQ